MRSQSTQIRGLQQQMQASLIQAGYGWVTPPKLPRPVGACSVAWPRRSAKRESVVIVPKSLGLHGLRQSTAQGRS